MGLRFMIGPSVYYSGVVIVAPDYYEVHGVPDESPTAALGHKQPLDVYHSTSSFRVHTSHSEANYSADRNFYPPVVVLSNTGHAASPIAEQIRQWVGYSEE